MKLSIIIVSYNTAELTIQTLDSVAADLKTTPELKKQTEIILVDNNSHDNSQADIKKWSTNHKSLPLQLITNTSNTGFAVANNQGLKEARGEYLLLLNSDTIVQPGALSQLVSTFEEHPLDETTAHLDRVDRPGDRLGILAAHLLNPDGSTQLQGGSFPTLWSLASHMLLLDDLPVIGRLLPSTQHTGKAGQSRHQYRDTLIPIDWVGGTALCLRRQVLDEIGLLDENIFMYGEDIELCLRAASHHWDVAIVPQATVTHLGSASSTSKNALIGELKGYLYIWSKHKPHWQIPIARSLIQLGCRLRSLLFGTMGDKQRQKIYQEALRQL